MSFCENWMIRLESVKAVIRCSFVKLNAFAFTIHFGKKFWTRFCWKNSSMPVELFVWFLANITAFFPHFNLQASSWISYLILEDFKWLNWKNEKIQRSTTASSDSTLSVTWCVLWMTQHGLISVTTVTLLAFFSPDSTVVNSICCHINLIFCFK